MDDNNTPMTEPINLKDCYTPAEAAKELCKAPGTLQNWRTMGIGPRFQKDQRNVYYPKSEIEEYKRNRIKTYSSTAEWKIQQGTDN